MAHGLDIVVEINVWKSDQPGASLPSHQRCLFFCFS